MQQIHEVVGPNAKAAVEAMKDGDVILLREYTLPMQKRQRTARHSPKTLASICDVFVNDAFGTAHRAHCSNVGVAELVDTAVVGYSDAERDRFLRKCSRESGKTVRSDP